MTIGNGTVYFSDINAELRRPWNQTYWLGDTEGRALAGRPSGQIWVSDFRGKTFVNKSYLGNSGGVEYFWGSWGTARPIPAHFNYPDQIVIMCIDVQLGGNVNKQVRDIAGWNLIGRGNPWYAGGKMSQYSMWWRRGGAELANMRPDLPYVNTADSGCWSAVSYYCYRVAGVNSISTINYSHQNENQGSNMDMLAGWYGLWGDCIYVGMIGGDRHRNLSPFNNGLDYWISDGSRSLGIYSVSQLYFGGGYQNYSLGGEKQGENYGFMQGAWLRLN